MEAIKNKNVFRSLFFLYCAFISIKYIASRVLERKGMNCHIYYRAVARGRWRLCTRDKRKRPDRVPQWERKRVREWIVNVAISELSWLLALMFNACNIFRSARSNEIIVIKKAKLYLQTVDSNASKILLFFLWKQFKPLHGHRNMNVEIFLFCLPLGTARISKLIFMFPLFIFHSPFLSSVFLSSFFSPYFSALNFSTNYALQVRMRHIATTTLRIHWAATLANTVETPFFLVVASIAPILKMK